MGVKGEAGTSIQQEIRLPIVVPKAEFKPLSDLIGKLQLVENHINRVNDALNGLTKPRAAHTPRQLESLLKPARDAFGRATPEDVAKAIGRDVEAFKRTLADMATNRRRAFLSPQGNFKNLGVDARKLIQQVEQTMVNEQNENLKKMRGTLGRMFTPEASKTGQPHAKLAGDDIQVTIKGLIPIALTPANFAVTLSGPIPVDLNTPKDGGGGRAKGPDGRFLPGGGGDEGGGGKKQKGWSNKIPKGFKVDSEGVLRDQNGNAFDVPAQAGELRRVYRSTSKKWQADITTRDKTGREFTRGYNYLGEHDPQRIVDDAEALAKKGDRDLKNFQREQDKLKRAAAAKARAEKAVLGETSAARQKRYRADVAAEKLPSEAMRLLHVEPKIEEQQAQAAQEEAVRNERIERKRKAAKRKADVMDARSRGRTLAPEGMAPPVLEPPKLPKPPKPPKGDPDEARLASGLHGLTSPTAMLANLTKVTAWAIPATVAMGTLYKAVDLVSYSFGRMIDVGLQTARLSQVFRGVGGTARELTDDVMKLAVANGRSTEEAMASAIQWSRLGLTRVQVNAAVKTSLVAANVAEISAAEATEHLSSIYTVYNLRVSELDGVLGMLNNTSNKLNVTNADLLEGLSRSANSAKQFGIGLPELQGMIGATVANTGQTGSQVGNMVKTILTRLTKPEIQDKLLSEFDIATTLPGGKGLRPGSDVLGDIWAKMQGMNTEKQGGLSSMLAGSTQGNRFLGLMDNYVESQRRAIDAQLNLNSAQSENAKILATIKSQQAGVRAEWDRMVVSTTKGDFIQEALAGVKSVIQLNSAYSRARSDLMDQIGPTWRAATQGLGSQVDSGISNLTGRPSGLGEKVIGGAGNAAANFTQGFTHPWTTLQYLLDSDSDTMPDLVKKLNEAQAKAGASATASGMFATLSSLPASTPSDRRAKHINEFMTGRGAEEKNLNEFIAQFTGESGEAILRAKRVEPVQAKKNPEAVASLKAMSPEKLLRASEAAAADAQDKMVEAQNNLAAAEDNINDRKARGIELTKEQVALLADVVSKTRDAQKATVDNTAAARQNKAELQSNISATAEILHNTQRISQIFSALPSSGLTDDLRNEAAGLKVQIDMLSRAMEGMDQINNPHYDALVKQQKEMIAARADATSGRSAFVGSQMAEQNRWRRVAEADLGTGVGLTQSDKLLDAEKRQRGAMQTSLASPQDEAQIRGLAARMQLMQTLEKIKIRSNELQKEEKQILIETNHEFSKQLIMAGPGKMLGMLAARKLMGAPGADGRFNISGASFLSASPEMRGFMDQQMGGDAMRTNLREQNVLGPRLRKGLDFTEGEAEANAGTGALGNRFKEGLDKLPALLPLPEKLNALADAASAAADPVNRMAASANTAAAALDGLADKIKSLSPGQQTQSASSGNGVGLTLPSAAGESYGESATKVVSTVGALFGFGNKTASHGAGGTW